MKKVSANKHTSLSPSILLTLLLLFFYFLSFLLPTNRSLVSSVLERLARNPFENTLHLALARLYQDLNPQMTTTEFELSQSVGNTRVLGDTNLNINPHQQRLSDKEKYWQEIIRQYPAFRDGYVQLLYLSLNLGKIPEAKAYYQQILTLDPNFQLLLPIEVSENLLQ